MKKRIFLGIGLLLILLPIMSPSVNLEADVRPPPVISQPELDSVVAGTKLHYNISEFSYGAGVWDTLDMLLSMTGAPSFGYGLNENLEGSELQIVIGEIADKYLYQYNWDKYWYENQTLESIYQMFMMLELDDDLTAYANVSDFSFPTDFINQTYEYYYDFWPWGRFSDPIDPEFWNGFNSSFPAEFVRGYIDNNESYGWWPNQWDYPHDDWYDDDELYYFGYDMGEYLGYRLGWDWAGVNYTYYDEWLALDAIFTSFQDAKTNGFTAGQTDFITDRIPDSFLPWPGPTTDLYTFAYNMEYNNWYSMWYEQGFQYEGAQVYFNHRLYDDLYKSEWDTYWRGYVDGYRDYYYSGQNDGWYAQSQGWVYGDNYYPPYWYEPWDEYDEGRNNGAQDGYNAGYDDGYYLTTVGEEYLWGMESYVQDAYFDGFDEGANDAATSQPYYEVPVLPFASPATPFEEGANFIYDNQYRNSYDRGFTYGTLVSSPNSLYWMWSNGPFYNMTLPDVQFTLGAGSLIPIPVSLTGFTDLEFAFNANDYEFSYDNHTWEYYWPFSEAFLPAQTFDASGTNWVSLDDLDAVGNETSGDPGFNTTYDVANDYFLLEMHINASEPGILLDVYWGYDTVTGTLLNVTASIDFYQMTDTWATMTLELDDTKTEVLTVTAASPSTWTYSINDFIFYYDLPPTAPADWADDIHWFKMNGTASIGNPLLKVQMKNYVGLWAVADYTFYNPTNTSDYNIDEYRWPMIIPAGHQMIADFTILDGLWTTATSVIGHTDYLVDALNALAGQNINVDLYSLALDPQLGSYYDSTQSVMYYYMTIDAAVNFQFSMLNGDWQWETSTFDGTITGYIWAGIDYTTGVIIGAGLKTSIDFLIGQTPDYGMNGAGISAYMEVIIGSTYASLADLDTIIGGLPVVGEFSLVSILSILSLAGIASAVIFFKRRK